jgi:multicomponent Na+:H+ antiporter subunit E
MIAGLAVVWVLFWGDLSLANVVSGLLLGGGVAVVFPLPPIAFPGRFRPLGYLRLVGRLLLDLVRSSFVVAAQAFRFGHRMHNAVLRVDLRSHADLYLTFTTELVSLVPGSLVLEARRRDSIVYLHVMDVRSTEDLDAARRDVLAAEARVLRAFGSDAEVAALDSGSPLPARGGAELTGAAGPGPDGDHGHESEREADR